MRKLLVVLLCAFTVSGYSQGFPSIDSLRGYNTKYTTNSALLWFSNLRGQTLLRGIIDYIDTVKTGNLVQPVVDTLYSIDDSTLRYRSKGQWITFYNKGVYDYRRKVDTAYGLTDTSFAVNINGTQRIIIVKGKGISASDTTNKWINNVYRKAGTDSVFFVKGSTTTYAFKDSAGGGGTPAGSNTQIQYNNSGAFGASSYLTWDNTNRRLFIDKGSSDSAALTIDGSYTGIKRFLTIRPPVKNDSTVEFNFWSELNPNDNNTRSNHVLKIGSNLSGAKATVPKIWDAWESNWYSGGARYLERHYEMMLPNGENIRLFSNTNIIGSTLANTTSIWDFRAGSFSFTPLRYNSNSGIFINTGSGGGNPTIKAEGNQPYLWLKDTVSNGQSIFQQTNNKTVQLNNSGMTIAAHNAGSVNLTLENVGGSTGNGSMELRNASGNAVQLVYNSASVSNYASQFYIYNQLANKMLVKQYSNGNIRFAGTNTGADQGTRIQLAERAWLGGGLFITTDSLPDYTSTSGFRIIVLDTANGQVKKMNKSVVEESMFQSATYTPTLTNVTNVASSSVSTANYQRVGNTVHVWGEITITATSNTTATEVGFSLPIASGVTNSYEIAGTALTDTENQTIRVMGDASNNRAAFKFKSTHTNAATYSYHFTYVYVAP